MTSSINEFLRQIIIIICASFPLPLKSSFISCSKTATIAGLKFSSTPQSPVTMRGTGLQRLRAGQSWGQAPGPLLHCPERPLRSPLLRPSTSSSSALATSEAGTGSVSAAAGVAPRPVTLSLATANIPQTLAALFQIDRILQPQKYLLLPRKYLLLLRALPCKFVSGPE